MASTGHDSGDFPGPRQPNVAGDHDKSTHAERERALRIVAEVAEYVKREPRPAVDALAVMRFSLRR